ncbi:10015_t:CDS:10 [Diversispora eburnea]|uniref:10015_t:CDS:1 n=1 Tax=Diversispora eburnea TaxID=1213867 RepID=A0A9N8ZLU6_9GLOM|nr:10015_t:CDS:10 [Diversispora eburnea]
MSKKYMAKDAVRSIKNYTKGYSETQSKVRKATSNNPWGPSGSAMYEIAQATYNPLNDHGKNWRHVFKALTLLHYCLNEGSPEVVTYAKENIYIVKTLQEFQYIDEHSKDQGLVVRQKAKEITNLLQDEDRLNSERRQRTDMRNRMTGGRNEVYGGSIDRSLSSTPTYENSSYYDDEEAEMRRAMEESLKTAESERKDSNEDDAEFQKALKLSKEEEERRQAELARQTEISLFDQGLQSQQNNFTTPSFSSGHLSTFGNNYISNLSSPDLSSPGPHDEKHAKLASLIGNRGDGMDTFGNIGNLRVPTGTGFANSGNLANQSSQSLRRSNSAGNLSGITNNANPFLADTSSANNAGSGAYNTFPSSFTNQSTTTKDDLFSTFGTTNSLRGFVSSQPSKNPFQTLNDTSILNPNKPKTLNDLRESQFNQQSQQQTLNAYRVPNQPGFWS